LRRLMVEGGQEVVGADDEVVLAPSDDVIAVYR
jgi:hypothetical protein